ncbi:MAG: thymidine phosphorylase, partial [Bacillota bacterium]
WFCAEYGHGRIPDCQMAAWLMAVFFQGLSKAETVRLTQLMAASGRRLDLRSLDGVTVDKHSTGGVGDTVTLVAGPLIAAAGLIVAKLAGRGLGHTGGTIDKLESIPGFRADLPVEVWLQAAKRVGVAISATLPDLVPLDGRLYALRDATATVDSLPLIAASVMSKKLAVGADCLVLDVKTGLGAFLPDRARAAALAALMVELGRASGIKVSALLTSMDQPLGGSAGNSLEVAGAIRALQGEGAPDLTELSLAVAAEAYLLAGLDGGLEQAYARARRLLAGGEALVRFQRMVEAQGGDPRVIDDPRRLPTARCSEPLVTLAGGTVASLDAKGVGLAAIALGAGRRHMGETIDPAAGIEFRAKVGDRVAAGEALAILHHAGGAGVGEARRLLSAAYSISESDRPVAACAQLVTRVEA